LGEESLRNVVVTVAGEFKWTPDQIDKLWLDDADYHGLIYWYNYVKELNESLKPKPKPET